MPTVPPSAEKLGTVDGAEISATNPSPMSAQTCTSDDVVFITRTPGTSRVDMSGHNVTSRSLPPMGTTGATSTASAGGGGGASSPGVSWTSGPGGGGSTGVVKNSSKLILHAPATMASESS